MGRKSVREEGSYFERFAVIESAMSLVRTGVEFGCDEVGISYTGDWIFWNPQAERRTGGEVERILKTPEFG